MDQPYAVPIYLESGKKRVIAGAVEWPGWCRWGKDEAAAMEALFELGRRYAEVLKGTELDFAVPESVEAFEVAERLEGNATTDFGVPALPPASDLEVLDDAAVARYETILQACWHYFDAAVAAAEGRELRKGPRGGGRELDGILEHVMEADVSYLKTTGFTMEEVEGEPQKRLARIREAIVAALGAGARGELPERGPRGGKRWPPRYFVRRVAYHVLDHAWEIEDRAL